MFFSPTKNVPSLGGSWTLPNTWFLEPTRVDVPDGILIGSYVTAQLVLVTSRQTDRHTERLHNIGNSNK